MRKAQTQAITLVLISGIIIALMGFAYSWGKPLIDKRTIATQFSSAAKFMEDLDKEIVDMAGSCSFAGGCEKILELPVPGIIRLDEPNNSIIYEFDVSQPLITQGEVFFNTADNGTHVRYGETPGVITLKGKSLSEGSYRLIFSVRYRELYTMEPPKGYVIELSKFTSGSGNNRIVVSYDGSETRSGQAYNSGDLVVSKIKVQAL